MPINVRFDGDVVVLSNFARLMNDPRYVDASRDLRDLLDQGHKNFIVDLSGVRETGSSFLGLLMTLTRQVRQQDAGIAPIEPRLAISRTCRGRSPHGFTSHPAGK